MRVLFVGSGNKNQKLSIILVNQAKSLIKNGIEVEFYPIIGKGFRGYLKNIINLRRFLSENSFDIIHAHYSLSAYVCAFSGADPLVVTLMGSDVYARFYYRYLNKFFNRFFWITCIVKSSEMGRISDLKNAIIIPNGVDIDTFHPELQEDAKARLGLDQRKKYVLFASDPTRKEKNFPLAKKTFDKLKDTADLLIVKNSTQIELNSFYNAVDVILLTSLYEGSPNVIKEAMACNRPIVATNVGDVRWVFGETEGCWISSFKEEDIIKKLDIALKFASKEGRTKGRERIIGLGLDSDSVAKRIIEVYENVITEKMVKS